MDELKENLKTLLKKAINNAKDGDEKGEWITINGTHVFIPEGKTAEDVIKEKGWEEKGEGKEKSETKKESNTTKDTKKHIDRIEKLIKKYNLEPHEEDELLDELGSFEAKLDEGLEPREEEELREQLFDFEDDIKRHQEMKKQDKSQDNPSEGKKEIQHLNISGGGQALSNYAFSAYPTQVKKLEEKGEIPKGVYGEGGNSGRTAVFKALLYKHRNETLGKICDALNKSDITYRNWQPADGYDKDDKVIDFGKQGAELWAKDYNGNWNSLYLKNKESDDGSKKASIEKIKNGLSEIIKNCNPETEEDLKVLKGLKDILEEQ